MTTNTNSVVRNAVTLENMNISNGIINSTNSFLELKTSGHNGSNAIILTSNSGTNETIEIHNTRGNLNHALHFVSNAGGMYVDTNKNITLDSNSSNLVVTGNSVLLNPVSGSNARIEVQGSDTHTGLNLLPKGDARVNILGTSSNTGGLRLYESQNDSSNYIEIYTPSGLARDYAYKLPSSDGSNGQFLKTNGTGTLDWDTVITSIKLNEIQNGDGDAVLNNPSGFIELKTSGHDGSNAIVLASNTNTNETIEIHNTRGNLNHALHFVSNAGGMYVDTSKTITLDSGNDIILDATGDIILDADGGNVSIKDGGSNILDIGHDGSGNWNIMNTTNNKKINFVTTDNNGAYHDVVDIDSTGNVNIKNGANSITFKDSLSNIGSVTSGVMDIRSNFINLEATSNVVIKSNGTQSLHFGYQDLRNDGVSGGEWKIVNTDTNSNIHLVTTDSDGAQNNVMVADSYGRVGIGTDSPSTLLQIESSQPYLTLKNNTSENTNGGCESKIIFKNHNNITLAQIQGSHYGSEDDTKGSLIFSTHDGSSLIEQLSINSNGNINIPSSKSLNFGEGDDISLTHVPYSGFHIDGNLSSNKSLVTDGTWTNIGDIDGTTDDGNAGFSVSINSDGSTIAYGIPGHWYDNDPSGYQGEVKVKTYSGSGSTWNDLGETIIGENNLDDFGICVSLNSDGRTIVIGGDKNDANGTQSGHVRVFEYSEFTNDDTGNYYYQSQTQNDSQRLPLIVTSSTSTAPVVGTSYWKQKGFDINGESVSSNDDQSGLSVDINSAGNIIVIGANRATIADGTADRGHARIYKYRLYTQADDDNSTFHYTSQIRNGTQTKPLIITPSTSVAPVVGNYYWTQLGNDIDNGDTSDATFGSSVSINSSGSRLAIGNYKYNTQGYAEIYEYSESSDSWTQLGSDIQGVDSTDSAGISVNLNALGDVMAIGSQIHDNQKGHVRIFRYIEGTWTQLGGDIDGEGTERLSRGLSFSDDGNIISMGARNYNSGDGRAKVYRYVASSNSWSLLGSEIAGETGEKFGVSTDISSDGTRLIVGTQVDGGNGRGSVRIYDLTSQTTSDSGWISGRDHFDSKYKISCSNNIQDSTKLTIDSTGNIGIGTETPATLLHVNGYQTCYESSLLPGNNTTGDKTPCKITLGNVFSPQILVHYPNNSYTDSTELHFKTGGNNVSTDNTASRMVIQGRTGHVGIGFTSSSVRLSVNGETYSSSGYTSSDDRIKYNEQVINSSSALNLINQLSPQKYEKITEEPSETTGNWMPTDEEWVTVKDEYSWIDEAGLIAQEVRDIPELAWCVNGDEVDSEGNQTTLRLNYNDIYAYHISATKELSSQLNEEKAKTATLETQMADLLARVTALENP